MSSLTFIKHCKSEFNFLKNSYLPTKPSFSILVAMAAGDIELTLISFPNSIAIALVIPINADLLVAYAIKFGFVNLE